MNALLTRFLKIMTELYMCRMIVDRCDWNIEIFYILFLVIIFCNVYNKVNMNKCYVILVFSF